MVKGTLATLSMPGLLQLLAAEGRTGRLRVEAGTGAGGRGGAAWLEGGRIVHAECDAGSPSRRPALEGVDAVYELALREEGAFEFEPGVRPPRRTVEATTDQLLMEAACRRDADRRPGGAAVDPSSVPSFAPVPEGGATPRFNTLQWRLLACVDGRKDVGRLAREAGLGVEAASRLVSELVQAGVLRLVTP